VPGRETQRFNWGNHADDDVTPQSEPEPPTTDDDIPF
jgi:hypothetical protein